MPPKTSRTGASAPSRMRYANGVRRRAELVDAAMRVFGTQGYQGLSLRQLAEAMGTSHTMILHHFGSKERLLEAVLVRREEMENPWRDRMVADMGALEAAVEVMRHNATIPGIIRLDTTLQTEAIDPEHPAHDYIQQLDRRFLGAVRSGLEAEREAGRLREGLDLDLVAQQMVSLVHGVQITWLHDPDVDMAAVMQSYVDLLKPAPAS